MVTPSRRESEVQVARSSRGQADLGGWTAAGKDSDLEFQALRGPGRRPV